VGSEPCRFEVFLLMKANRLVFCAYDVSAGG
jgi:hypothetical protein